MLNCKLVNTCRKVSILGLCFFMMSVQWFCTQQKNAGALTTNSTNAEQGIFSLSKEKWRWVSERKVDSMAARFHEKAVFVHIGGTMTKDQKLNVIRSGGIHYKQADIQEKPVQFIGNTAILLNKIRLVAVVGGNEVTNPFVVTEDINAKVESAVDPDKVLIVYLSRTNNTKAIV